MAEAGSASGAPDPARIATRAQLAAALVAVKGGRSYSDITTAAGELRPLVVRQASSVQEWKPESLSRGTVSDWLGERGLPTRNKLRTFLWVCAVPADRWGAWEAAVARVKAAPPGRPIDEWDPIELGVHPAIRVDTSGVAAEELPALPPYVEREHDIRLRGKLRTGCSQLIVLTGGSSAGKTRACLEAVRAELPGWRVLYPLTAGEFLKLLADGITPGSVVWLTETQRYLSSVHGREVAVAIRRLLTASGNGEIENRVVMLGSMWSRPYWQRLTRHPQPGEDDEHPEIRDLLTRFCAKIDTAENFRDLDDEQRAQLEEHAGRDPRLDMARRAGGPDSRLTQQLAGGPLLVTRYTELQHTEPLAHAVLTAAMDARRIGYQSPLPAALLIDAVPGYLRPEQMVAPADWFSSASTIASEEIHGVRALTPIRTDQNLGSPDAFVLHDYLEQHALGHRRRDRLPARLWQAVVAHAHDPHDLTALAAQAERRALNGIQLNLCRALAQALGSSRPTDRAIMIRLAADFTRLGDDGAAEEILREWAAAGDQVAARRLAELLDNRKDIEEPQERAHDGDDYPAGWPADTAELRGRPPTTGIARTGQPCRRGMKSRGGPRWPPKIMETPPTSWLICW